MTRADFLADAINGYLQAKANAYHRTKAVYDALKELERGGVDMLKTTKATTNSAKPKNEV